MSTNTTPIIHFKEEYLLEKGSEILKQQGRSVSSASAGRERIKNFVKIDSDGSTRRFWRFQGDIEPSFILTAPASVTETELAEARSAWKIGRHLHQKGIAVPEVYGWDSESGLLVFEDLGDTRLYDIVDEHGFDVDLYREVIAQLVTMQLQGRVGFDVNWCWDSACYDKESMIEKESGYFLKAFWRDFLQEDEIGGIHEEFTEIARQAERADNRYFLHRDFQSRNIMINNQTDSICFIDFQAGRFGPLGYDLASLLIDPYVQLNQNIQEELLNYYFSLVKNNLTYSFSQFREQYNYLALQRNLQIVGAFSFLYKVRGKAFFKDYLIPALQSLELRLTEPQLGSFSVLQKMVRCGLKRVQTILQ